MPQNKLTEPIDDIDASDLPQLTEKQYNFVYALLEGKSYSDAYREAYDAAGMKPRAIWREASLLASHQKVTQWLEAARLNRFVDTKVTLDSHVRRLAELSHKAQAAGNYGAAVNAEVNIGKASGLYIERHEDVGTAKQLQALERILQTYGPEHALRAAERIGFDISQSPQLMQALEKARQGQRTTH